MMKHMRGHKNVAPAEARIMWAAHIMRRGVAHHGATWRKAHARTALSERR